MEKVSSLLNRKWYKTTEYFKSVANGKLLPKRTNSNSNFIWNARTRFKEFLRTLSAPWVNKLQFYNFFFQCGYILSHWRGLIMHDSSLFLLSIQPYKQFLLMSNSAATWLQWNRGVSTTLAHGVLPLLLFSYFYCITPRISIDLFLNLRPGSPHSFEVSGLSLTVNYFSLAHNGF